MYITSRVCLCLAIIKKYSEIIYNTSAKGIGTEASKITPERPVLHGFNGKFSSHLASSGMPVNNGLNCAADRARFLDYNNDW